MDPWVQATLAVVAGYLLGSVPFGVIVTQMAGAGDLRKIGSGNIGATNVLRTGRKGLAALTLLLDSGKGAVAVLIAKAIHPELGLYAALGAFYGHLFPVWLGFRGGKGIATYLGLALALHWQSGAVFAVVWLAGALLTRYSSVGGVSAALFTPASAAFFDHPVLAMLFLLFGATVVWTHRQNVSRLIAGTEPRIGKS